jgi:hypothetical protein
MKRSTVLRAENHRTVRARFWTFCVANADLDLEFDWPAEEVGSIAAAVLPDALMKGRF